MCVDKAAFSGWWGARMFELALIHHQLATGVSTRQRLAQVGRGGRGGRACALQA
jgi:hypothetical protein